MVNLHQILVQSVNSLIGILEISVCFLPIIANSGQVLSSHLISLLIVLEISRN